MDKADVLWLCICSFMLGAVAWAMVESFCFDKFGEYDGY